MDDGISSIGGSSAPGKLTEAEKATLADLARFDKEADEELEGAFDRFAAGKKLESEEEIDSGSENETDPENETDSESGGEDQEINYHTDRSFVSEQDEYSDFSAANPILHRNNSKFENGLRKGDSYNGTDDSSSLRHSHSALNSHVSDEDDCSSTIGQTIRNSSKPNYLHGSISAYDERELNSGAPINSAVSSSSIIVDAGQTSENSPKPNYPKESISVSDAHDKRQLNSEAPINSAVSSSSISVNGLKEEYQKLFILYEATFQELTLLKAEEMNYKRETDNTIKTLKLNLDLLESEKTTLTYNLQASQNLISDYEQEKNKLLGEVVALKSQLSSMSKTKNEIQSKLESSEVTIQSLEKQLIELNRADNLSKLRDHHNSILEEMKLRHEKDILSYKKNIDQLQSKLKSKIKETEDLTLKNSEFQRQYQQLQLEKAEWINKMSEELEVAQKKCQVFLESGTIEEMNRLKLQVQRLEEEKSNIERENSLLKDEMKSLKAELDTAEALQKFAFSKGKQEASSRGQEGLNLQQELEKSLKNVRSLRSEKHSLKKQLNSTEIELNDVSKKAQLFESQCVESEYIGLDSHAKFSSGQLNTSNQSPSEMPISTNLLDGSVNVSSLSRKKKMKELEEKLHSLSSNESTTTQFYEKKIQALENELSNLKKSVYDASVNEKLLIQSNEELQKKMTELIQKHMTDKIQAVKMCQEQMLALHESSLQKEKEKIQSKADAELKEVCFKYENKISEMEKQIKTLNDGLYDSKNQYIALYKENKNLQTKFDEISKPKERDDIEKEIRLEYEGKLKELRAQLTKENKEYLAGIFKEELEKAQIEWTEQKMVDIKDFIENTKQRLNDEFQNCLQKEQAELQKKLNSEKERLHQEYEETKANLEKQIEEERDKLTAAQNEDLQIKWERKLNMLKDRYENEIKVMQNQFDSKLLERENVIKYLNERLSAMTDRNDELQKLKQDFVLQQEKLQKEKDALTHAETILNENLKSLTETEHKLRDKLKRYQKHVASVKKHHEGRITTLQTELSDLQTTFNEKQNQLCSLQEKYEQEVLKSGLKKYDSSRSVAAQTEEEMVPKSKVLNMEDKFFKCLMNISDGIRHYVNESKQRNAEKIQAALIHYHQQVSSKLLQDLTKDVQSFTPTIIIPRTSARAEIASKETFETSSIPQTLYNARFKTSTPASLYSTGKHFEQAEKAMRQKDNMASNDFFSIPNFNYQTNVKSVHAIPTKESNKSSNDIQNLHSASNKTPKLDIFNSGDSLLSEKVASSKGLINNFRNNHNNKDCESVDRFEDISYDFVSLGGLFGPSKMNHHRSEQDDYSKYADKYKDSFPVKL